MRDKAVLCGVLGICVFFVTGCAMRSPMNDARAGARKRALAAVLEQYGEALRQDDVQRIMEMTDPEMGGARKRRLRNRVRVATWLRTYTAYQIDMAETLSPLDVTDLIANSVTVDISGTNVEGQNIRDVVRLCRRESKWVIEKLSLQKPERGAIVDLPEDEEAKISSVLMPFMNAVKEGKVGTILSFLPDNEAVQIRTVEPGFIGGLLGQSSEEYPLQADLDRASRFTYTDWPESEELPGFAYVGPGSVMALYDVSYNWKEGLIFDDVLRIEILLTLVEEEWEIGLLRLHGEGIPGS